MLIRLCRCILKLGTAGTIFGFDIDTTNFNGNEAPQALWVFSSNACGTYGLEHLRIVSAGRSGATGVIVFSSDKGTVKIPGGAGMLLRVNKNPD